MIRFFLWTCLFCVSCTVSAQRLSLSAFDSLRTARKATKVIDLRGASAYERGAIRFAQHLPYQRADFKEIFLQRYPTHIPLVLYCQTGQDSQEAQTYLSGLGYREVYYLVGGFDAWTSASRPYVSQYPTTEPIAPFTYAQLVQTTAKFPLVAVLLGSDPCPVCAQQESLFRQTLPQVPVLRWEGSRVAGLRQQLQTEEGPLLLIFQKGQQVWRLDGPWNTKDLAPLVPVFRP